LIIGFWGTGQFGKIVEMWEIGGIGEMKNCLKAQRAGNDILVSEPSEDI
jgi:hypothetical protein